MTIGGLRDARILGRMDNVANMAKLGRPIRFA